MILRQLILDGRGRSCLGFNPVRLTTITIALFLAGCSAQVPRSDAPPARHGSPPPAHEPSHPPPARPAPSVSEATPAAAPSPMEEARAEFTDVWERVRANLELDRHAELASVQAKLAWYRRHQDYLDRVAERARPYLYYIVEQLEARGMPEDLALLPIVESAYHPFAYSQIGRAACREG